MLIHSKIRQEIIDILQSNITEIDPRSFYNGRSVFIDIDEELKAIAVFIEEANCEESTMCSDSWTAQLNIAIYLKSIDNGDNELDVIAQHVADVIQTKADNDELVNINNIQLIAYQYDQDEKQATWHLANLVYQIEYTM